MSHFVLLFLSLAPMALCVRVDSDFEENVESDLGVGQMTPEDRDQIMEAGIRELSDTAWDCPNELPFRLRTGLERFLEVLEGQCDNITNICRTNYTLNETHRVEAAVTFLNEALFQADIRGCAAEMMNLPEVQPILAAIDGYRPLFERADDIPGVRDRTLAVFDQMASWQQALVALGDSIMDRRLRYSEDQQRACDSACHSCSGIHGGKWGDNAEPFRFKCILKRRHELPAGPGIHCLPAKRRVSRPWAFKTWCTNQDWVEWHFQSVRVSAMTTCATHSLVARIQSGSVMPDQFMLSCMLWEQGQALYEEDLMAWRDWIEGQAEAGDGVVSEGWRATLLGYFAMSTAEGMAGMREASQNTTRLSPDDWTRLLQREEFNVLPQGVSGTLDCAPTLYPTAGQRLHGMFAVVASGLIGVASIVLVPFAMVGGLGLFVLGLIRNMFIGCTDDYCFDRYLWAAGLVGGLTALVWLPPWVITNTFGRIRPAIRRDHLGGDCAGGLLQLGNSAPVCFQAMKKGDAQTIECPGNSARSVVISCDPESASGRPEHAVVLRGDRC